MIFTANQQAQPFLIQAGARPVHSLGFGWLYLLGILTGGTEFRLKTQDGDYLLLGEGNR